jgi:uncharacterized protein (TIGR03067 family)
MSFRVPWAALCLLAGMAPAARAVNDTAVAKAIARGVDYLKQSQSKDGVWQRQGRETIGATALAGLTLLECGVPANDPAIQKAARALRDVSIPLTETYSIALCILFMDRLGEAGDVPLIESLTVRLLAGQCADGGWTYECPSIGEAEMRRLQGLVRQREARGQMREDAGKERAVQDLPPQIRQQLLLAERLRPATAVVSMSDNSNTQFATLALWVGHRHGLPVEKAAARIEARFRTTQNADGGWGYHGSGPTSSTTPAMTCAGLLGLAVADGVANEILAGSEKRAQKEAARESSRSPKNRRLRDPARDRSVRAGLLKLGTMIGQSNPPALDPTTDSPNYYYLWSLERVAVVFGLQTIGYKDWYGWGAELVLAQQQSDGSWKGNYPEGGVDTSFALLFLRRSNLVQDLTSSLRGAVQDPGDVALKAGGVLNGDSAKKGTPAAPEAVGAGNGNRPGTGLLPKLLLPEPAATGNGQSSPAHQGRALDPEARRLSAELVQAAPAERDALLQKYRESKGIVYTQALAAAIPGLSGPGKIKARDALAERVARMTASTVADKLQDEDLEIRRAACLACAMKEQKKLIPKLIPLLEDPEATVVRAAHVALRTLTGRDFGPADAASRAERDQASAAWKFWWSKQDGSLPSAQASADEPLTDQEQLQGTWVLTTLERDGKAVPKTQLGKLHLKITFHGNQVTFEYPDHTELGTYQVEPTANPKTMDVVTELDKSKGIYRLDGDSLTICGVPNGEERPAEFATKRGTRQTLFLLKRQKP